MGRRRDAWRDVGGARARAVERDVRELVRLEERERVGPLCLLEPRAVAELDERHERREARRGASELGLRRLALREARVVLEEDAAELAGELERLERGPEEPERLVGRLALVPRHRRRRLDVKGEVVGRPAGPALRHGGVGQGVVGRVDLDDVEALGVVAEALLGGRDAAGVPGLQQALVRPRARPDPHGGRHARTIDGAPVRAPRPFLAPCYLTRTSPDCAVKPLTVPLTHGIPSVPN